MEELEQISQEVTNAILFGLSFQLTIILNHLNGGWGFLL